MRLHYCIQRKTATWELINKGMGRQQPNYYSKKKNMKQKLWRRQKVDSSN